MKHYRAIILLSASLILVFLLSFLLNFLLSAGKATTSKTVKGLLVANKVKTKLPAPLSLAKAEPVNRVAAKKEVRLENKAAFEKKSCVKALDQLTFKEFMEKLKVEPSYCGADIKESVVRLCFEKNNHSQDLSPECTTVLLHYFSMKASGHDSEQPHNLSDKVLIAFIVKTLFSGEGLKKVGAKQMMPLLNEMLRRHPENIALLRVFIMLKSAPLLLEPLSENDHEILDRMISLDFNNVDTRNIIVIIYSNQKDGAKKISALTQTHPHDIYPYASLVGEALVAKDQEAALKWANYGLAKNPGNKQFLALKQDLARGTFDIRNYYSPYFDISGLFSENL